MDLARRGLLRFSLHLYNNMHDVERVVDLTRKFLKRWRRESPPTSAT
jgi:selenocysteine lyase/cysteine desulfurase